jgi:hypothetical protein
MLSFYRSAVREDAAKPCAKVSLYPAREVITSDFHGITVLVSAPWAGQESGWITVEVKDKQWYERYLPIADRLYDAHLELLRQAGLLA